MADPERSPIEGIVDIDSLAVWVQEYRADSFSDPSIRRIPLNVLPKGENRQVGQESLNIYQFPWENLPVSLQEVAATQFGSANRPGVRKFVYAMVKEDNFQLELRSADIVGRAGGIFDTYAETYSSHGPTLDFVNTTLVPSLPSSKGIWQISKIPLGNHLQFRHTLGELHHGEEQQEEERAYLFERLVHSLESSDVTMPASVDQARDIGRFLVLARPYRAIAIFGADV